MQINYFFRKQKSGFHSIENLFHTIIEHLPTDVKPQIIELPESKLSFWGFFYNCYRAWLVPKALSHITGDIQYIGAVLNRKKTVLTIHDIEVLKRLTGIKKIIIKYIWYTLPGKRLKYITTISEFSKNEIIKYTNIPAEKIIVIHNCVSIPIPNKPSVYNEKPSILQVGTKDNKNLIRLTEALEGLDVKLIILGKPNHLQRLALSKANIDFEYYVDLKYEQVLEKYQTCLFLAFISTYEGFGLPILEAQSLDRAVLASNIASIPEVAGDSVLYVDPFNVDDIRDGIIKMIANPDLREKLVIKGRENIKKFHPDVIAKQYYDLYQMIEKSNKTD